MFKFRKSKKDRAKNKVPSKSGGTPPSAAPEHSLSPMSNAAIALDQLQAEDADSEVSTQDLTESTLAIGQDQADVEMAQGSGKKKGGILSSIKSFFGFGKHKKDVAKPPKPTKRMADKHVDSIKSLGGGSANDVKKVDYKRGIGESGKTRGFFKSDWEQSYDENDEEILMPGAGYVVGIEEADARNSARAVASSRLDKFLGTDVLSEEVFAKHGGKTGSVSSEVEGKPLQELLYEEEAEGVTPDEARKANLASGGKFKVEDDGKVMKNTATRQNEVDWADPEVQKGMANLQLIDYLTGQVDRHGGNVMVDPGSGKVKGIDNDLSFGKKDADHVAQNRGMPELIDYELGMRMMQMDDEEMVEAIRGRKGDPTALDDDEIEKARERFALLKGRIDDQYMNDELVFSWNEHSYDRAMESGKDNNLLAHMKSTYEGAVEAAEEGETRARPNRRAPGRKIA